MSSVAREESAVVDAALADLADTVGDAAGRNGEPVVEHARGTCEILRALGVDRTTLVAAALFGGVSRGGGSRGGRGATAAAAAPDGSAEARAPVGMAAGTLPPGIAPDAVEKTYGPEVGQLVDSMRQLLGLRQLSQARASGDAATAGADGSAQLETLRRMLLAMAADIRVVLIRLASRLQTLRWHARVKQPPPREVSRETLEVLAPLANRLGIWQLKWELEDLAFRFLEPELYKSIARRLDEKRVEREAFVAEAIARLRKLLADAGIRAEVSGRPKHILSIVNKMRSKGLEFEQVQDLRAFRVIVEDVKDCYTALGLVHELWQPIPREFDDYIARPKPNGYRSLHTVVVAEDGRPFEVQIRTREMHQHAEYGVAAHWRYKEASTGLAGAAHQDADAEARIAFVRQLLAWQREVGESFAPAEALRTGLDDRIYVLTPQARVIELPTGSTPVDFAYHVHTDLGHRCRGARVDGQMVPLNTPIRNGQTVDIVTARRGRDIGHEGPSRDWLNPALGYVHSPRARTKIRQWFNAQEIARLTAEGRASVERALQREGRTALPLEVLASRLGYPTPDALFVGVAREEIGPRLLEAAIRGEAGVGAEAQATAVPDSVAEEVESLPPLRRATAERGPSARRADVLVVGVDFLMTQLARCCRPVPPDPIVGFVTKGRGVSIHRAECKSFRGLAARAPERVLQATWGEEPGGGKSPAASGAASASAHARLYPSELIVRTGERRGVLRDLLDVLARDKVNVVGVNTRTKGAVTTARLTVEVRNLAELQRALASVMGVPGVLEAVRA